MNEDDDEIMLSPNATFKQVYTFLPYTHWRIKEILKYGFDYRLDPIGGYKCNRVPNYVQGYNLVDNATGKIIQENVHLDFFRKIFAKASIPLHSEVNSRNAGAENFMEIVKNL